MIEHHYRWVRAYRAGRLVCGHVEVRIGRNASCIGRTAGERRYVTAQFVDRLHPALHKELRTLVLRDGAAAERIAKRLEPITLVSDVTDQPLRLVGKLGPPCLQARNLRDVEFAIREHDPASDGAQG